MTEAKTMHWSAQHGNRFRNGLHPGMLTDDGYKLKTVTRCIGMGKSEDKLPMIVHFDRTYVKEVIKRTILSRLKPQSYNDFQKVVSEAWKEWKDELH